MHRKPRRCALPPHCVGRIVDIAMGSGVCHQHLLSSHAVAARHSARPSGVVPQAWQLCRVVAPPEMVVVQPPLVPSALHPSGPLPDVLPRQHIVLVRLLPQPLRLQAQPRARPRTQPASRAVSQYVATGWTALMALPCLDDWMAFPCHWTRRASGKLKIVNFLFAVCFFHGFRFFQSKSKVWRLFPF